MDQKVNPIFSHGVNNTKFAIKSWFYWYFDIFMKENIQIVFTIQC